MKENKRGEMLVRQDLVADRGILNKGRGICEKERE